MRTLATQFRLQRLIRLQAEQARRMVPGEPPDRPLATVRRRLLAAARDVGDAWSAERAAAGEDLGALHRHVSRSLVALEAALVRLTAPGPNVGALSAEFREVAIPLLFFLRGLDGASAELLAACRIPAPAIRDHAA